jgi:hypothetical protein
VRMLAPFAVGFTVLVLSVGIVSAQAPSAAAAADPKMEKAAAAKKAMRNVSGTVRSSSNEAVVVAGRDKGKETEWTFAVEPTTNIRKGSKSITAGDLKAGDAVQVRFVERDGKALADSILVKAAKKAAAKK